jgi:hypothetical protein
VWVEGQIRFAFGKHRGQPPDVDVRMKPGDLAWMLHQTFFEDTRALVKEVLSRSRSVVKRS